MPLGEAYKCVASLTSYSGVAGPDREEEPQEGIW